MRRLMMTKRRLTEGTTRYKIVVRGEWGEHFAAGFEGMDLKAEKGRTVLVGEVVDQAHLHGLLDRVRDFGLDLLSVKAIPEREEG